MALMLAQPPLAQGSAIKQAGLTPDEFIRTVGPKADELLAQK